MVSVLMEDRTPDLGVGMIIEKQERVLSHQNQRQEKAGPHDRFPGSSQLAVRLGTIFKTLLSFI